MPAPSHSQTDSDDDVEDGVEYMLGFVEPPVTATDLLRHRFPSKVGGRPAWLDPVNLPTDQLTCPLTGRTMNFLLQVYAPVDSNPDAFHRTIFVFVSPQGESLAQPGAVRALRCQLPRSNPYYSFHPAGDQDVLPQRLKECDRLIAADRDPWHVADAEEAVASGCEAVAAGPPLFDELELIVEPEPAEQEASGVQQQQLQRMLDEYQARVASEGEYNDDELPAEVLDDVEQQAGKARQHFASFQARVALSPEQCLRYCFTAGAAPLWPSHLKQLAPGDVPSCSRCGGPRRFEFQIMPQLLSFMSLDEEDPHAPDW
eukprot:jgi/Chrzof1/10948/Cz05g18100.t1